MIDTIVSFIIGLLMFIFSFKNIKKKADNYFSSKRNTNLIDFSYNLLLFSIWTVPFLWGGLFFGSFLLLTFLFDLYEFWGDMVFIITGFPIFLFISLNIIIRAINYFSAIRKKNISNIIFNMFLFFFSTIYFWYLAVHSLIIILMIKFNIHVF